MGKARKTVREDPARLDREAGWAMASQHPALDPLRIVAGPDREATDSWVRVELTDSRYGEARCQLSYHPKRLAPAEEWAWVFTHALLHIGLNHYDPLTTGRLARDFQHEAAACDEVDRLQTALRIGRRPTGLTGQGTAGACPDIVGPILSRDSKTARRHAEDLATGLSAAVTLAVDRAGGVRRPGEGGRAKGVWDLALSWFIASFPLLGGLAAGFSLVADAQICRQYDIAIAAVDPTLAEIYVNPLCHLTPEEWRFVLAHEILHAGLRHGERAMGRQPYLWNVAADYVVNGWLVEMGVGAAPDGVLHDPELKGLSVEAVYDRIVNDVRRLHKLATLRGQGVADILGEPLPLPRQALGGIDLDEFYRRALSNGLALHESMGRGYVAAGLVEEIKVIDQPPLSWDVALARWFEAHVRSPEPVRSFARPSRRQASAPDIPRPGRHFPETLMSLATFGVVLDTSGSMSRSLLGQALGAIASLARSKDVPAARVVFCDAAVHDAGYLPVDDIAGRVKVTGRGGTVLQPAIRFLERTGDFPADGPILIITDGHCDPLRVTRQHAYLIPAAAALPFRPAGPVFRLA
ncbi:MAG: VWA-like domain-containing protein [Propionibacteriaceae bacterium]|nr:VWA-like domain-containing protein [Propionibacteriaceae bacterium]